MSCCWSYTSKSKYIKTLSEYLFSLVYLLIKSHCNTYPTNRSVSLGILEVNTTSHCIKEKRGPKWSAL